jgi:hypothetical protein
MALVPWDPLIRADALLREPSGLVDAASPCLGPLGCGDPLQDLLAHTLRKLSEVFSAARVGREGVVQVRRNESCLAGIDGGS